ncbi:MAG: hypothetical protein HYR85_01290 [Planctomycetes bacterium]|nr:hypothetical protein [Planctomycetota bacterium]MBI3843149.1 hypothetical protein [Planctomycetota bacterium]
MNVTEGSDGTLVVTHDSTRWSKWLFGIAIVFGGTALYDFFIGTRGTDRLVGVLGGVGVCVIAGLALLERTRFTFDPNARTITWRRRWAWWSREGALAFESVKEVAVQVPIGDDGVPSRRISLQLVNRPELPLTAGYSPDGDEAIVKIARRIREALGMAGDDSPSAAAAALAKAGRPIDAIRLLRQEHGLSLTEAKRRVDEFKSKLQ